MNIEGLPTTRWELVTPEVATEWLKGNVGNRKFSKSLAEKYAKDITRGKWDPYSPPPIPRTADGILLDGQHRLHAILLAGKPVLMQVIEPVPQSAQLNMDAGRKRTFSDALRAAQKPEWVCLAAAVRRVMAWKDGHRKSDIARTSYTYEQMISFLETEEGKRLEESVLQVRKTWRQGRGLTHWRDSVMAVSHYIFSEIDQEDAVYFFEKLCSGASLAEGDVILLLRETLSRPLPRGGTLEEDRLLAYVIKAWNAYRQGRSLAFLRYTPGGAVAETFPEPM